MCFRPSVPLVRVNVPQRKVLGRVPKSPKEVSPACLVPASPPHQIMKSLGETTLALWSWPQEAHEPLTHTELVKSVPGIWMPPPGNKANGISKGCDWSVILCQSRCLYLVLPTIHLLLGRKAMTNLDSVLKGRDITLPTKAQIVKAMIFPVVMYGCESWTIKKAECQRIGVFKLWCWRRLLRVP